MTITLTLKECIDGHRSLWSRLAKTGHDTKNLVTTDYEHGLNHKCYPCHYIGHLARAQGCMLCPFEWPQTGDVEVLHKEGKC